MNSYKDHYAKTRISEKIQKYYSSGIPERSAGMARRTNLPISLPSDLSEYPVFLLWSFYSETGRTV